MWFDGEWESTWTKELGASLLEHVHALQPDTLVNSRVSPQPPPPTEGQMVRPKYGDFGTPEQKVPDRGVPGVDWESCITMNGNWGFNRADEELEVGVATGRAARGDVVEGRQSPAQRGPRWQRCHAGAQRGAVAGARRLDARASSTAIHGTSASPFDGTPVPCDACGESAALLSAVVAHGRELLLPGVQTLPTRGAMMGARDVTRCRCVAWIVPAWSSRCPRDRPIAICSVLALDMPSAIPSAY
jgi:hypothetical protein